MSIISKFLDKRRVHEETKTHRPNFTSPSAIERYQLQPIDGDFDRMRFYGCYKGDKYVYKGKEYTVEQDENARIVYVGSKNINRTCYLYENPHLLENSFNQQLLPKGNNFEERLINERQRLFALASKQSLDNSDGYAGDVIVTTEKRVEYFEKDYDRYSFRLAGWEIEQDQFYSAPQGPAKTVYKTDFTFLNAVDITTNGITFTEWYPDEITPPQIQDNKGQDEQGQDEPVDR